MKAKLEAIREAYGKHWESVKDFVDENGYCHRTFENNALVMNVYNELWRNDNVIYDSPVFRPKSLQGIENNNSWLVFDGIRNINNLDCWVFTDKKRTLLMETYLKFSSINEFEKITHFQEIKKPSNPIY